jgi:hypothetical protein
MCLYLHGKETPPQTQEKQGDSMKQAGNFSRFLVGFALLVTTSAFAADKGSFHVASTVMVGETELREGEYTVLWEGNGPDVQLQIKNGKKVNIHAPAKLVSLEQPSDYDAVVLGSEENGVRWLHEIHFAGKRFALQLEPQPDDAHVRSNDAESR